MLRKKGSSKETRELVETESDEVYNRNRCGVWSEESALQVHCIQLVSLVSCILTPSFTVSWLVGFGPYCILMSNHKKFLPLFYQQCSTLTNLRRAEGMVERRVRLVLIVLAAATCLDTVDAFTLGTRVRATFIIYALLSSFP